MKQALLVFCLLLPTTVSAQMVYDPTTAEFTASVDHNTLATDGTPLLSSYRLEFYPDGAVTPSHTANLGKPTPDATNTIRVVFTSLLSAPLTPGVVYTGYVVAVGPGGERKSPVSNQFGLSTTTGPPNALGAIRLIVTLGGLNAVYWDDVVVPDMTGTPKLQRIDAGINFDWGTGGPEGAAWGDTFAARWTGFVVPEFAQAYTFCTLTDDGVRLWINNQLVIDRWVSQSPTEHCAAPITLQAGGKVPIQMEYFENTGGAVAKLFWQSPSTPKAVVPAARLAVQ